MGRLHFILIVGLFEIWTFKLVASVERIDLASRLQTNIRYYKSYVYLTKRSTGDGQPTPKHMLGLKHGEDLKKVAQIETVDGIEKTKLQETYKGLKVFGQTVVVAQRKDGQYTGEVSGRLVEGIKKDLPDIIPKISVTKALKIAVKNEGDDERYVEFDRKNDVKLQIFVSGKEKDGGSLEIKQAKGAAKARLVYVLSYLVERQREVSKPYYLIDAKTGEIVDKWQEIESTYYAKYGARIPGIGGNIKMGKIKYDGKKLHKLKIQKVGNTCVLENYAVRVIHMLNNYTLARLGYNKTFKFDCKKGFNDSVNGGYSPLSDVLHHATVVYDMFKKWYKTTPLKFKIVARVHYGRRMDNAFWDRKVVTFGDGFNIFYPLVSLDIVGHEIGHGIVGQNSGLVYQGQSGGMNEAFADLTGEAAEFFSRGKVDWLVGGGVPKKMIALRYFKDPTKDGKSAGSAAEYCSRTTPVHYSSGIFRRAFYLLVHKRGWGFKKAYDVFVLANKMYWQKDSDFGDGACGAVKAAIDLGYNEEDVREAFLSVGVAACQSELLQYSDLKGSKNRPIIFKWTVPASVRSLRVRTTQGRGNVNIYVKKGSHPTTRKFDAKSAKYGNEESVHIRKPTPGIYFVSLLSPTSFSGVGLEAVIEVDLRTLVGTTVVRNLEVESCGKNANMTVTRLAFKAPTRGTYTFYGRTRRGFHAVLVRRGAPVDVERAKTRSGGYDSVIYVSSYPRAKRVCNMKPGIYHLAMSARRGINGLSLGFVYKPALQRIK